MSRNLVKYNNFNEYHLLHTETVKYLNGNSQVVLYPIKETTLQYRSIEVWNSGARSFKRNKKGFQLKFEIPLLDNPIATDILDRRAWKKYEERDNAPTAYKESVELLDKLFPEKPKYFFYELDCLTRDNYHGVFAGKDDELLKMKLVKYFDYPKGGIQDKAIKAAYICYKDATETENKELSTKLYNEWDDLVEDWIFRNWNVSFEFSEIARCTVVYPVAFSQPDWMGNHAGCIYFVETPDAIFYYPTK